MREFVAEIESLGRLRHKNLVNLGGRCKHNNDLLLVYDYIPNRSLDSLLFSKSFVFDWDQRFRILKGVAAGLLYLHEEWEQVKQAQGLEKASEALRVSVNSLEISASPLTENCNKLKEFSPKSTLNFDEPSTEVKRILKVVGLKLLVYMLLICISLNHKKWLS
ncbi:Lectin-domain containing receptor [Vigna angularis]|uniref:Lectin-domain containing receptor n=1 Tax=Phaseolus angularis TaxID=3914 RepID=A0A8T0JV87_PHAAN|nr:Lectin-domain containing receptor [Vigna angularis]